MPQYAATSKENDVMKRKILSEYREKATKLTNNLMTQRKVVVSVLQKNNASQKEIKEFEDVIFQNAYAKFSEEIKKIEKDNFFNRLPEDADVEKELSIVFKLCEELADEVISKCNAFRDAILNSSVTAPPVATAVVPQNASTIPMGLFAKKAVVLESKAKEGFNRSHVIPARKTGMPPSDKRSQTPAPKEMNRSGVKP